MTGRQHFDADEDGDKAAVGDDGNVHDVDSSSGIDSDSNFDEEECGDDYEEEFGHEYGDEYGDEFRDACRHEYDDEFGKENSNHGEQGPYASDPQISQDLFIARLSEEDGGKEASNVEQLTEEKCGDDSGEEFDCEYGDEYGDDFANENGDELGNENFHHDEHETYADDSQTPQAFPIARLSEEDGDNKEASNAEQLAEEKFCDGSLEDFDCEYGDEYGDEVGDDSGDGYNDEFGEDNVNHGEQDSYAGDSQTSQDVPVARLSEEDHGKEASIVAQLSEISEPSSNIQITSKQHEANDSQSKLPGVVSEVGEGDSILPPSISLTTEETATSGAVLPSMIESPSLSLAQMIAARSQNRNPDEKEKIKISQAAANTDHGSKFTMPQQSKLHTTDPTIREHSDGIRQETSGSSLIEMIAARSQKEESYDNRWSTEKTATNLLYTSEVGRPTALEELRRREVERAPAQSQPSPFSRIEDKASKNDSSSLSLAQMIALQTPQGDFNSALTSSKKILDRTGNLEKSQKVSQTDNQTSWDQDDSSSMSLAEMIAARSQNIGPTNDPTPQNRRECSEPGGKKQTIVYKNRINMIKRRQKAAGKGKTTGTRPPPTTSPRQKSTVKPRQSQPPIQCTVHLHQTASIQEPWKQFESKRRIEMILRSNVIKEEWLGGGVIMDQGIYSTRLAERIVLGFVRACKQLASDLKATSEDSVFNDKGQVVQTSFSQKRLSKSRESSHDTMGIFGSSSPISAALFECQAVLAAQAETLEEASRQIMEEFVPRLKELLGDLSNRLKISQAKLKCTVDKFDDFENNVISAWNNLESLLPSNQAKSRRNVGTAHKNDGWFAQQSYCAAVLHQRAYLLDLRKQMDNLNNRFATLESDRLGEIRSILLDGFYQKQNELFQHLLLYENEMVKNLEGARIDLESLEEILYDQSKTRHRYSQSHRSSIINRSKTRIVSPFEESDAVPFIEAEFGTPLGSPVVLSAAVVELRRSDSGFSSFVSVSWKRAMAIVLDTGIVYFLELPPSSDAQENEKQSVDDAFRSLRHEVQFEAVSGRSKKHGIIGKHNPFLSWRLSKCSVDISNIQEKIVEVTEVGRQLSSPNLQRYFARSSGSDNDADGTRVASNQIEAKYSLRFYSAADASKWIGAFEMTKGKLHNFGDVSISDASSLSTSMKSCGTLDGDEDGTSDVQDLKSRPVGSADVSDDSCRLPEVRRS